MLLYFIYIHMDFIVKFTIGLFVFSLFLLFFKSTKTLTKGYMNGYINKYQDFHEIMNQEEMEKEDTDNHLESYDLPKDFLNSSQDPNNIVWKIND